MNDPDPKPARSPRRRRGLFKLLLWLLLLAILAFAGWRGWLWWQARDAQAAALQTARTDQAHHLDALQTRLNTLRDNQQAQARRLQQAEATNRLLREELLGIGQRAALLEGSVAKLAERPQQDGLLLHNRLAMRLDSVEWLLAAAQQRLALAGDLDAARHAYALAAGLLEGVDDPDWLGLRQALAQERAALDAVETDPRTAAATQLDRFAAALDTLPRQADAKSGPESETASWWQRLLQRVVQVQPSASTTGDLAAPDQRGAALAAMRIDLAVARGALERGDTDAFRAALSRVEHALTRLWPASAARTQQQQALQALREAPLELSLPELGSSLRLLRTLRDDA